MSNISPNSISENTVASNPKVNSFPLAHGYITPGLVYSGPLMSQAATQNYLLQETLTTHAHTNFTAIANLSRVMRSIERHK